MFVLGMVLATGSSTRGLDVDRDAAVEVARGFARKAGYGGKLGLSGLSRVDGNRMGFDNRPFYSMGLTLPDKRWISVYVSDQGRIDLFQVVEKDTPGSRGAQVSRDRNVVRMAKKLVQLVGATGEYQMRDVQVGQTDPFAMVYFDETIAGHKFFNLNPTYGYRIDFDTRTGKLTYFQRPKSLPSVTATQPQISAAKAMALLEHWGKTHYQSGGGVAYLYGPTWRYTPMLVAELGYFKFKNERKARLVWQAHAWMSFNPGTPRMESGLLRMYADAVTGELVAPDDPGIG